MLRLSQLTDRARLYIDYPKGTTLAQLGVAAKGRVRVLKATTTAPPVVAPVVPPMMATTWAPGVRGIPARATVCATLTVGQPIQPALDACPVGQVVQLGAGEWVVNDYLRISTGITLRGAGPALTTLRKTDGAREGTYLVDEQDPVVIVGVSRWPHADEATARDLAADAVAGARTVTVSDATGFVAGGFALVDENDYGAAAWLPVSPTERVWASDRVVYAKHDPPRAGDDPFPASLTWFSRAGRPVNEMKEIESVVGQVVTFTTPLHAGYRRARGAQLTRLDTPHVRLAGIEDLTIAGGGDGNLRFEAAAYSWAKNIRSTAWAGAAIDVQHGFRVEIRDSLIDHTVWPYPGGAGYGISLAWSSSEILIENNAIRDVNKVMVMRSSGAGSVVGYNALDDGWIGNFPGWQEVGLNASHMGGSHHVLFEGNDAWNYDSDNTHGTSWGITVFRNWLRGRRTTHEDTSNVRTVGLMAGSWHHAVVGNVLGEAGRMAGWDAEDSLPWGPAPAVWRIGYDPGAWHLPAEPQTVATLFRDGNFDYVLGATVWSAGTRALPNSLYLTAKPAFLGTRPWPFVTPTGTTKTGSLPARERLP